MADKEPANKKWRLSLSLKDQRRFSAASKDEIAELSKAIVPKNTSAATRWAVRNFNEWFDDYNSRNEGNACPDIVLSPSCSPSLLNQWLRVFVTETRAQNGENYPPKTLYALLTGLLRHMRAQNPSYPNFLGRKNPAFAELIVVLYVVVFLVDVVVLLADVVFLADVVIHIAVVSKGLQVQTEKVNEMQC